MKVLLLALTVSMSLFAASDLESCLGNLEKAYQSKQYQGYFAELSKFAVTASTLEYSFKLYVRGKLSSNVTVSKNLGMISNSQFAQEAFETFSKDQKNTNLCFVMESDGEERIELIAK